VVSRRICFCLFVIEQELRGHHTSVMSLNSFTEIEKAEKPILRSPPPN
jgi:hypothetical protein